MCVCVFFFLRALFQLKVQLEFLTRRSLLFGPREAELIEVVEQPGKDGVLGLGFRVLRG